MKKLIVLSLIVVMIAGAFASYTLNGYNVQKSYTTGEKIKGDLNLTFTNEPGKELLKSNFEGNISLINFLDANGYNEGEDYHCSTPNCGTDYVAQSSINQIDINGKKIVGLKIFGNDISDIQSITFKVTGNGGDSCVPPLSLNFLDENLSLVPDRHTEFDSCFSPNTGCFDKNIANYQDVLLSINPYCENVTLPSAPAFKLGVTVKNSTTGKTSNLTMQLYDNDGTFLRECDLPLQTQNQEDLNCIVKYPAPAQHDYLVCIVGKRMNSDGADYKIKSETQGNVCGTDNLGSSYGRDYDISAKIMRFAQTDFEINDSVFESIYGDRLSNYVFDYVLNNYNSVCNPDCIIPISLDGINQNIVFSNVLIKYKDGNTLVSDNALYSVNLEEPEITSKLLKLNLELANFIIPESSTLKKLEILLGNQRIINEPITIAKGFTFDINPKFVAFGQNVNFVISSSVNVSTSTWDFGDGTIQTVNGKSINHAYTNEGTFDTKVDAKNVNGSISSKHFSIIVGNAKDSARITIEDYKKRIENLKKLILNYQSWIQPLINDALQIEDNALELTNLEKKYNSVENDSEYVSIMNDLLSLSIPYTINSSKKGNLPIIIGGENIDVSYIEQLSTKKAENTNSVREAIVSWMSENLDVEINFDTLSGFYAGDSEPIVTSFKFDVIPKVNAENSYFIIPLSQEEIKFKSNYQEKALGNGVYIPLGSERRTIEFLLYGEVGADELGAYVSPALQDLNIVVNEDIKDYQKPGFAWSKFSAWIIALLVVAFVSYILLQEWYKRNYERSLFKTEESLYNLINFINNARGSGLTEGQIRTRLKQNSWTGEQITYASKKLDGKRTGMFEIPLFRFFERNKVKNELNKRKQGEDATFIKEPRF